MKNYAQNILQFSGYPLEPIVAKEVKKSYESKLVIAARNYNLSLYPEIIQTKGFVCNNDVCEAEWFSNYE